MAMTKLNIEKAVDDAVERAASDDRRTLEVGGAISAEEIRGEVSAELGQRWTLTGLFRRFRRTHVNEGAIRVTKEF
jgi:hypothetical protein